MCGVTPLSLGFAGDQGDKTEVPAWWGGVGAAWSCLRCRGHYSGVPALMGRGHPIPFVSAPD